jgi:hypothetical protein
MKLEFALRGSAFDHSFLHLNSQLDCLSRQPFCSKAFVVGMEFWLGLAVRYRLPRRKRVECPSLEFVRNLLLGRPLRLYHLCFPFSEAIAGGGWLTAARSSRLFFDRFFGLFNFFHAANHERRIHNLFFARFFAAKHLPSNLGLPLLRGLFILGAYSGN